VIDQNKGPAMGKTTAIVRFLRYLLTATCLCVAASHGAHAGTLVDSSLTLSDLPTTIGSASVLPDGTPIIDVPLATNGATGGVLFSNLASNPELGNPVSSGNASPGLEAFDGSNLPFIPEFDQKFDQKIFGIASVTLAANVFGNDMVSASLDLDEGPRNLAIPVNPPDAEASDSATLALTGLGFALAGSVGRNPRALRRLMGLENRDASREPATEIAFYVETRRRALVKST
jgi:hypothetical protein